MDNDDAHEKIRKWRDEFYQTRDGADVLCAIRERIANEAGQPHVKQLNLILAEEYERQGLRQAARAVRRRNGSAGLDHWYEELERTSSGAEIITAIEERIESETDATKRQELGFTLAYEYNEREDYAASEAVYLRLFEAEPHDPFPLIQLAQQKLYREDQVEGAMRVIDRAIEAAYCSGNLRRNALTVKAQMARWKKDYQAIEGVLRQLMQLGFERGNSDTWIRRDFFDRLPPGSIDPELARQYAQHCREGDSRQLDDLILLFAGAQWRKVAMIISEVLDESKYRGIDPDENAVAERIRTLVENGRLEAQGNLYVWRQSEVKLRD